MRVSWLAALICIAAAPLARGAACAINPGNPLQGTPPKLCGCALGSDFSAFGGCVVGQIDGAVDDAVAVAEAAKQTTINTLTSQNTALQAQLQKPWVAAMNQIDAAALTTCLAGAGMDVNQTIAGIASNPVPFVRARLTDLWQKSMANPALAQQFATPLGASTTLAQRINHAETLFAQLAAQDPAALCLWTATAPFRTQAKAMAQEVFPTVRAQYDAMIEQRVKPAVNAALVATLRPALRQLAGTTSTAAAAGRQALETGARVAADGTRTAVRAAGNQIPPDMRLVVLALTLRQLLEPGRVSALNGHLGALATAVTGSNAAFATAALGNVDQGLTQVATLTNAAAIEVALAATRIYGHLLIDAEGPKVIDQAYVTVNDVTVVVINLVTAVSGIEWEPTDAVAELVSGLVAMALFPTKPLVSNTLIAEAHAKYDQMIDQATRAIREGKAPSTYLANAGPLGELLSAFPTEAELLGLAVPEVAQMRAILGSYHESVRSLARAAAGARR